ncbi:MAG: hypothetical protein IT158_08280 [Bryobacterales bacterium]|nr:hypothetical protein [Bryobacterales bacterium]
MAALRIPALLLGALSLLSTLGCGYRVAGRADMLPAKIKTIAVPPFGNATTRYRVSDRLAAAVTREFISRTRYRIVADPNEADAVLNGSVVNFMAYPTIFDPVTSRASGVQVILHLQLFLTDRATGAALYQNPNWEFRERYEISVDQRSYFEESDIAMDRLTRDAARSLVSAVLENF